MNELISVIVPIYNLENYIDRCLESIIGQTHQNLEIILVDDGSTDRSGKICNKWKEKDERIQIIHKINGGAASARNVGIEYASGEFVAFVDGDDWIESNMYEILLAKMISTKSEIATCGMYLVNGKYRRKYKCQKGIRVYNKVDAIKNVLLEKSIDVSPCNKLFQKSVFLNLRFPEGETNEDAAIILDIFENATNIVQIGSPYYYYYQRDGSVSSTFDEKNLYNLYKHAYQIEDRIEHDYPELVKYANVYVLNQIITIIKCLLQDKNGNRGRELEIYRKALKNYESKNIVKYLTIKRKILLLLMHLKFDIEK